MTALIWIGIFFCLSQSAMFSGLNLALFSISKLRLEIEASKNNKQAMKVMALREDSNFLLTTILWGNVGINVLLTLLSNSVLAGVAAFLFSTILITFFGEIVPQAYFSRHAMRAAALLSPLLRVYQVLLYPAAKSTALILDKWLGPEAVQFFQERDLHELIKMHLDSPNTDIGKVEGLGALNFLAMDDVLTVDEGETLDPQSVITLRFEGGRPIFPIADHSPTDELLNLIQSSGKKWVTVCDSHDEPRMVIDSDGFLRAALFGGESFNPYLYCHRPIVIRDPQARLGETILSLKVHSTHSDDDVIDEDIVIFWGESRRILTGSDILGRLLRGIVAQKSVYFRRIVRDTA